MFITILDPKINQVFCFAGCLLKWFKLESMRLEAYAATVVKTHHGDKHGVQAAAGTSEVSPRKTSVVEVEKKENNPREDGEFQDKNANAESSEPQNVDEVAASGAEGSETGEKEGEPANPEAENVEGSQDVPRSHSSEGTNVSV